MSVQTTSVLEVNEDYLQVWILRNQPLPTLPSLQELVHLDNLMPKM